MNDQERAALSDFLSNLVLAKGIQKDPEAENMIRTAFNQQPDAPYLVVQRAIFLQEALIHAKNQIAQLQAAKAQPAGGFAADTWGNSRPAAPAYAPQPPAYAPAPQYSGSGSFLGQVATTAMGVAGGALLFEGIESLFSHHNSGFGSGGMGGDMVENTVVNNYYGSDAISDASFDDDSFSSGADDSWI